MFQRNGPSAGAEEAERLDLEKHARLEAGLIDPVETPVGGYVIRYNYVRTKQATAKFNLGH